jgi:formiminotetrahydrofolate cyclodeaminase
MAEIDINTLLKAETYQGMTDEEIDAIIDYKIERAKVDSTISKDMEAHQELMRAIMGTQAESSAKVRDAFQTALDAPTVYEEVHV